MAALPEEDEYITSSLNYLQQLREENQQHQQVLQFLNQQQRENSEVSLEEEDEDEFLVEEVRKYRVLWDNSTRGYKDNPKKLQAWKEISQNLGKDVDYLKKRWKNLRDGMMRCLKKMSDLNRSGACASKVPSCKCFERLLFLRDTVSNKETDSNIPLPNFQTSGEIQEDFSRQLSPALSSPLSPQLSSPLPLPLPPNQTPDSQLTALDTTSTPSNRKRKQDRQPERSVKKTDQCNIDFLLAEALSKSGGSKEKNDEEDDSDWDFCKSLFSILKKLPPKKNRLERLEIQQVLFRYEFDYEDN